MKKNKKTLFSLFLMVPLVPLFSLSQSSGRTQEWKEKSELTPNNNWQDIEWLRGFNELQWTKRNIEKEGFVLNNGENNPILKAYKLKVDDEILIPDDSPQGFYVEYYGTNVVANLEYNISLDYLSSNGSYLNTFRIFLDDTNFNLKKKLSNNIIVRAVEKNKKAYWYPIQRDFYNIKESNNNSFSNDAYVLNVNTRGATKNYEYNIKSDFSGLKPIEFSFPSEFNSLFDRNKIKIDRVYQDIKFTNPNEIKYIYSTLGHSLIYKELITKITAPLDKTTRVIFKNKEWLGIEEADFFRLIKGFIEPKKYKEYLNKKLQEINLPSISQKALNFVNGVINIPSDTLGNLNTDVPSDLKTIIPDAKSNLDNLKEQITNKLEQTVYISTAGDFLIKDDIKNNSSLLSLAEIIFPFKIVYDFTPEVGIDTNKINIKRKIKQIFHKKIDITNNLKNEVEKFNIDEILKNVNFIDYGRKSRNDVRTLIQIVKNQLKDETVLENVPIAFHETAKYKEYRRTVNLGSLIHAEPGFVIKNDKNLNNISSSDITSTKLQEILTKDTFIKLPNDAKNDEEKDTNKEWGGRYLAKAPIGILFQTDESENEVLMVNKKKVDVIDRKFTIDFRDLRVDINDNKRVPFDTKNINNVNIVLDEKNSHAKNEYVVELFSYKKGSNNDGEPIFKYKKVFIIDSLNTEQSIKWFAWDPQNNPEQLSLITPELIVNGRTLRDENGNIRANPRYDKNINKATGTKTQMIYIPRTTLNSTVKEKLKMIWPNINLKELGVIAEASVVGRGALRNLMVSENSKNTNYFRVKLFDKSTKTWIKNPTVQDINIVGTDSENAYMSDQGIWLLASSSDSGLSNVRIILIDEDNKPDNYFLEEIKNKTSDVNQPLSSKFEDFWLSLLGQRFLSFLKNNLGINEEAAKEMSYEELINNYIYYVNISWKTTIPRDTEREDRSYLNPFDDLQWSEPRDFNGLTNIETLEKEVRKYIDNHISQEAFTKYKENEDWIISDWDTPENKTNWLNKLAAVKLKSDINYESYQGLGLILKGINSYKNDKYNKTIYFKNSAWHVYNPPIDLKDLDIKEKLKINISKYNFDKGRFVSEGHYSAVVKQAIKYEIIDLIKKELVAYNTKTRNEIILGKDVDIYGLDATIEALYRTNTEKEFPIRLTSLNANLLNEKTINISSEIIKAPIIINKPTVSINEEDKINIFEGINWKETEDFNGLTDTNKIESMIRNYINTYLKVGKYANYQENRDWTISEWVNPDSKNKWLADFAKVQLKSNVLYRDYRGMKLTLIGLTEKYRDKSLKEIIFKNSAWHIYNPPIDLNTLDIKNSFKINLGEYKLLEKVFVSNSQFQYAVSEALKFEIIKSVEAELLSYKSKTGTEFLLDKDVKLENVDALVSSLLSSNGKEFPIRLTSLNANLFNAKTINFSSETIKKPTIINNPNNPTTGITVDANTNIFDGINWKEHSDFNGLTNTETLEKEVRKYIDEHLKTGSSSKYKENVDWIILEWSTEFTKSQWLKKLSTVKLKSDLDYSDFKGLKLTLKGVGIYENEASNKELLFKNSAWHVYNPPIDLSGLDINDRYSISLNKYNILDKIFASKEQYDFVIRETIRYEVFNFIKNELEIYKSKTNNEIILGKDVEFKDVDALIDLLMNSKVDKEFPIKLTSLNANLTSEKVINYNNTILKNELDAAPKIKADDETYSDNPTPPGGKKVDETTKYIPPTIETAGTNPEDKFDVKPPRVLIPNVEINPDEPKSEVPKKGFNLSTLTPLLLEKDYRLQTTSILEIQRKVKEAVEDVTKIYDLKYGDDYKIFAIGSPTYWLDLLINPNDERLKKEPYAELINTNKNFLKEAEKLEIDGKIVNVELNPLDTETQNMLHEYFERNISEIQKMIENEKENNNVFSKLFIVIPTKNSNNFAYGYIFNKVDKEYNPLEDKDVITALEKEKALGGKGLNDLPPEIGGTNPNENVISKETIIWISVSTASVIVITILGFLGFKILSKKYNWKIGKSSKKTRKIK